MSPQMHYSTEQSFQNQLTIQQITQPPQQTFVGRKTTVKRTQTAVSRLYKNSIASPNSSIFQNECATTNRNNNALSQLNNNAPLQEVLSSPLLLGFLFIVV